MKAKVDSGIELDGDSLKTPETKNPTQEIAVFRMDPITYSVTEEAIESIRSSYMSLRLNSLDDVEGLAIIHSARMDVVRLRTSIEKRRTELNAEALAYTKANNEKAKKLTKLLEPIEEHLSVIEKSVELEKRRKQEEEKAAKAAAFRERIAKIISAGAVFDGYDYCISVTDDANFKEIKVNDRIIESCDEVAFNELISRIKDIKALLDELKKKEIEEVAKRETENLMREVKVKEEANRAMKAAEEKRLAAEEAARKAAEERKKAEEETKRQADALKEANEKLAAAEKKLQEERTVHIPVREPEIPVPPNSLVPPVPETVEPEFGVVTETPITDESADAERLWKLRNSLVDIQLQIPKVKTAGADLVVKTTDEFLKKIINNLNSYLLRTKPGR